MNRSLQAFLALVLLALAGCASMAPVQEMSDARQALQAAREANAAELAPDMLKSAEQHMERAAWQLEQGFYDQARVDAVTARQEAVRARELADQATTPNPH